VSESGVVIAAVQYANFDLTELGMYVCMYVHDKLGANKKQI